MGFLDTIANLNPPYQARGGQAYASLFPPFEQTTPQYPAPNPYTLAVNGYRRNELIYSCIKKWERAFAQASLKVYDAGEGNGSATPEEIPKHPARTLLKNPNPGFGEKTLYRGIQTYLKVAGFSPWEIELDNLNRPIALWPMRPDWCSFMRGPNKILRAIRYQPYGLPFADIPIERILLFQYLDPIFPLLKALSPSFLANRVSAVDNSITDFLKIFFERGAVINGLLVTDQSLDDAEAERNKRRWMQAHSGVSNWGDVAVIGAGLKYQEIGKDFRSMQFESIDAREERRICQCFDIDPILVATGDAAASSTYNNKEQAHRGWHRECMIPEWDFIANEAERQLSPYYDDLAGDRVYMGFDTSKIYALQEDRTALYTDVTEAVKAGWMYRDEARAKVNLDPIDDGEQVWLNITIREQGIATSASGNVEQPGTGADVVPLAAPPGGEQATLESAKALERKRYKAWLTRGKQNGKGFQFKHLSESEQLQLKGAQTSVKVDPFRRDQAYP